MGVAEKAPNDPSPAKTFAEAEKLRAQQIARLTPMQRVSMLCSMQTLSQHWQKAAGLSRHGKEKENRN